MRTKVQCSSISRAASTTLASAFVLLLVVVATPRAQAQTLTILHAFMGQADGSFPIGGLVRDSSGNLYGTTYTGSDPAGVGTAFEVSKDGKETVYALDGVGAYPYAGLVLDAGNLYGTAYGGGSHNCGMVFKLDKATGRLTALYNFCSKAKAEDGRNPRAGLISDEAGNLYGTTSEGGTKGGVCGIFGCGVVFMLDTTGKETVLYSFTGGADGENPTASLVRDAEGNLYGTTYSGGDPSCGTYGCGTVFKLDINNKESILHSFTGRFLDGGNPQAGLIRDAAGNLYGTTLDGGSFSGGTVFMLDPSGKESILHNFSGKPDGAGPESGVIMDAKGNLYGTTYGGGDAKCIGGHGYGCGVVFKLTP
jgi:uncharacterized repeat protein (TIGR03803 family)